jgi:hypothetical protein
MTDPLRKYASKGHRQVQGWLSDTAIVLLLDLARIQRDRGIHGPVCEIGVHHGRLFILLHHLTTAGERSVGWDLFEQQDQNIDKSGKGDRQQLLVNLQRHHADLSRVAIHTANSLELKPADVQQACAGAPRIFSVDGGHTAEITASDLRLAAHAIRDDGLIVLDDFFNEPWPGVAEGTCRYMAAPAVPLFPVAIAGNKFVFTGRRETAAFYRQELALPARKFRRRETVVFGEPVTVFTRNVVPIGTRLLRAPGIRTLRRTLPWRAVRRLIRR